MPVLDEVQTINRRCERCSRYATAVMRYWWSMRQVDGT
jgi:hypothetical protein